MAFSPESLRLMLSYQRTEITEHQIYLRLARIASPDNRQVLENIAHDELQHYHYWKHYTGQDVQPVRWIVWLYFWISRLLGLTFGIKLMERGEDAAQKNYAAIRHIVPDVDRLANDENQHEASLLAMLDEQRLRYAGSIVLGLNDALVELTGGLAGLTLALGNTRLIALSGLIVGIAAAMSMAASEYLSKKHEASRANPLTSSLYTGVAYIFTVFLLIAPYLLIHNHFLCLACTLAIAVLIIAAFNFYIAIATDRPFLGHFLEMVAISLGVAAISFALGYLVRVFLGVEV